MIRILSPRAALPREISLISSKSELHRLLICAAFADKATEIDCSVCADTEATARCLSALGAAITRTASGYRVIPIDRTKIESAALLDCGESASTLRFLLPIAAALGGEYEFLCRGSLASRHKSDVLSFFNAKGLYAEEIGDRIIMKGKFQGGEITIYPDKSSQLLSGALLSLPLAPCGSKIRACGKIASAPYISLTLKVMRNFGLKADETDGYKAFGNYKSPSKIIAEGDWSAAAIWLCAAAASGSEMRLRGLNPRSVQGDRRIIEILKAMGASPEETGDGVYISGKARNAISFDASDIPDLVPVVSACAAVCEGLTEISGIERLRFKESDRVQTIILTLSSLGADIKAEEGKLLIEGKPRLAGGSVSSHGDHRIAFCAAVAATVSDKAVVLSGSEAVNKSYPDFFDIYQSGGN